MSRHCLPPVPHRGETGSERSSSVLTRRIIALIAVGGALCFLPASSLQRSLHAQAPSRGKVLYDKWCAECHGEAGGGDGSAAAYMLPRPRDFTRALYQVRTTASGGLPTDADLRRVIDEGMPGTAMPGWKSIFSESDRDAVVEYIKSFSRFFGGAAPEAIAFGSAPGGRSEDVAEGRSAYQTLECFKCHGDAGRGDGPSAPTLTDDWDFPVRTADLSAPWLFNGGARVEDIYRRLRTGLDGTPMPSFSDAVDGGVITEEQLWHVARWVASLGPARPSVGDVLRAVLVEGAVPSDPGDEAWNAVRASYVPLVGQIIEAPRWFAPRVHGVWVSALHNGEALALRLAWNDPSRSPDAAWQEWLDRMATTMTDADGPVPTEQGTDRLHVQFPLQLPSGMEQPYFLGGDARRPVFQWRWTGAPEGLVEGTATGLDRFTVYGGEPEAAHTARFQDGQWVLVITRALIPADTARAPTFHPGRAIPIGFFAADGSNGEDSVRGAVSAWFALHLEVATPATAYAAPVLTALLTVGLGLVIVARAQARARGLTPGNTMEER